MADHDLHRWMRGVESEEPPELWTDISHRTPRRRPPRQVPKAVRYAGIALISVVVAAGIILPLKALLPLADRDKGATQPAAPGTDAPVSAGLNGRIAFVPDPVSTTDIAIATMNPDGTDFQTLLDQRSLLAMGRGEVRGMEWSPDGKWLAFSADWPDQRVYLVRADGTDLHLLTPEHFGGTTNPTWSPDGSKIAMDRSDTIYIVNTYGTDGRTIDPGLAWISGVEWSPDGSSFVFSGYPTENLPPDRSSWENIYRIGADGSGLTDLTSTRFHAAALPQWSPDGTRILFQGYPGAALEGHNQEIFSMNPVGADVSQLTSNTFLDQAPTWSPDGTQIAYSCWDDTVDQNPHVCLMNADGTGLTKLPVEGVDPEWAPSPDEPSCPAEIKVPDLTGLSLGEAKAMLNNSALVLGELQVGLSGSPGAEVVVSQDPAPGTSAPCGQAVSVVVGATADPSGPQALQDV